MNPEEQHEIYRRERVANIVKVAKRFARARFDIPVRPSSVLEFKVYLEIHEDKDFDYDYYRELCKKLVLDDVELNTSSFKIMSDQLYKLLSEQLPGSDISIIINNGDIGLTTHYV